MMKNLGTIFLLTLFLAGAYTLGKHQDAQPFLKKIDSLQRVLQGQYKVIAVQHARIDSLKLTLRSQKKSATETGYSQTAVRPGRNIWTGKFKHNNSFLDEAAHCRKTITDDHDD